MKTKRIHTVTVHGWAGTGGSITEAKADAVGRIVAASRDVWTPVICRHKGMVGVCWRDPEGWSYTISRPSQGDAPPTARYFTSGFERDRDEAVRGMCSHLAQNGFTPGDEPVAPPIIVAGEDIREFEVWARWQNAYKAHKDADPTATDEQCRAAANRIH